MPPRIEQPLAIDGAHVDIDDTQLLGELGQRRQQPPRRVEDERSAIEDQLVLAADAIDVDQPAAGVGRPGGQHLLPLADAVEVVGRGVDVDDQFGAGGGLGGDGTLRVPRVLADRYADADPADAEQLGGAGPRSEVALLVEDGVVGQFLLVVDATNFAAGADGRRVVQVELLVHEPNHGHASRRRGRHLVQGGQVVGDKTGFEQEVLGGVTRDRQFGEDRHVGAGVLGRRQRRDHPFGVAGEIAHDGIDLAQRHAEASHGSSVPSPPPVTDIAPNRAMASRIGEEPAAVWVPAKGGRRPAPLPIWAGSMGHL